MEINANHIRPVRTGFVYATATPLHLGKSSQVWDIEDIQHILVRHEQGATHMAEGYARATGKPGVFRLTLFGLSNPI